MIGVRREFKSTKTTCFIMLHGPFMLSCSLPKIPVTIQQYFFGRGSPDAACTVACCCPRDCPVENKHFTGSKVWCEHALRSHPLTRLSCVLLMIAHRLAAVHCSSLSCSAGAAANTCPAPCTLLPPHPPAKKTNTFSMLEVRSRTLPRRHEV